MTTARVERQTLIEPAVKAPSFRLADEYEVELGLASTAKPAGAVTLQVGHLVDHYHGPKLDFSSSKDATRVELLNRLRSLEAALIKDNQGLVFDRLVVDNERNEQVEFRGDRNWDLVMLDLAGGLAEVTIHGLDRFGCVVSDTVTYVAEKSPHTYSAIVGLVEYIKTSGLNQSRGLA